MTLSLSPSPLSGSYQGKPWFPYNHYDTKVLSRGYYLQRLIASLVTSSIPFFPAYFISLALLALLQILNIIWTFFIFKVIFPALFIFLLMTAQALHKALVTGSEKADKYDSEEEDDDQEGGVSEDKTGKHKEE